MIDPFACFIVCHSKNVASIVIPVCNSPGNSKLSYILTLKVPITTTEDDIYKYFFIVCSEKLRLDVSSESSARQS